MRAAVKPLIYASIFVVIYAALIGAWLEMNYQEIHDRRVTTLVVTYIVRAILLVGVFELAWGAFLPSRRTAVWLYAFALTVILIGAATMLADPIMARVAVSAEFAHDGALITSDKWLLYLIAYSFLAYASLRVVNHNGICKSARNRLMANIAICTLVSAVAITGLLSA